MRGVIGHAAVTGVIGLLSVSAVAVARMLGPDDLVEVASTEPAALGVHEGLVHGRVVTDDGQVYEGRIRFGQDEETLWGHQFNGARASNPWIAYAPTEEMGGNRHAWTVLGIEIGLRAAPRLERPFMARLGDITRIDARGRDLRVTLKSGTVAHLDRYEADDFADGVRVWDGARGIVDLSERGIRSIEFFPASVSGTGPLPLYGTVRTEAGDFTGLIQWEREAALQSDYLHGHGVDGPISLRFQEVRSIVRQGDGTATVILKDGSAMHLARLRGNRHPPRGTYVDDARYGRVLVSWDALRTVEFGSGGTGAGYDRFRSGHPIAGTVTTRSGRSITGRIVYDLDESESTETLDAPADGIDYMIPFAKIAAIEPRAAEDWKGAHVTLRSGEVLRLERWGDLSPMAAGPLIFPAGGGSPEYIHWRDVERIEFAAPDIRTSALHIR